MASLLPEEGHIIGTMPDVSKLMFSIIRFLKDQLKSCSRDRDRTASIEVAIQCLESAYKINTSSKDAEKKYQTQQNLLDMFNTMLGIESVSPQLPGLLSNSVILSMVQNVLADPGMLASLLSFGSSGSIPSPVLPHINGPNEEGHDIDEQKPDPEEQKRIIKECKKALAKDSSDTEAYAKMGMAHTALGDPWEAAECYREALDRDPDNKIYLNKLEKLERKLQDIAACSGFQFGQGERRRDFSSLLRIPSVQEKAEEMIKDSNLWHVIAGIMSGESHNGEIAPLPNVTGNHGWENKMKELLDVGDELATLMEQENPELVAHLRAHIDKNFFPCK